jgi:hypothetical protein
MVDSRWATTSKVRPANRGLEGGLDDLLRDGVQVGGGLVEDDDATILEDHPGDGDPLLLAARQPVALGRHQVA